MDDTDLRDFHHLLLNNRGDLPVLNDFHVEVSFLSLICRSFSVHV